jgi:hypothetical protein
MMFLLHASLGFPASELIYQLHRPFEFYKNSTTVWLPTGGILDLAIYVQRCGISFMSKACK